MRLGPSRTSPDIPIARHMATTFTLPIRTTTGANLNCLVTLVECPAQLGDRDHMGSAGRIQARKDHPGTFVVNPHLLTSSPCRPRNVRSSSKGMRTVGDQHRCSCSAKEKEAELQQAKQEFHKTGRPTLQIFTHAATSRR